jgi:serine/threonine protein kinase
MILTTLQRATLKAQNFTPKAFLDDGTFSTVVSVTNDLTDQVFAVKIVDKLLLLKHDKCSAIMEEKRVHSLLHHENIIKLFSTFQDDQSLCN